MDRGKATLEGMSVEIQVEILRYILRREYPIELCPLDSESDQAWGFGSLGVLRTSRHFSDVSLGILYGENSFELHRKVHIVRTESELVRKQTILAEDLEKSRWSTLRHLPRDVRSYASSLDCLDLISQTNPGQQRLRRVSIELSERMTLLFMEGLVPQILKRLRTLQSVQLIVKIQESDRYSFASCLSPKMQGGSKSKSFGHGLLHEFLRLIKSELAHIKTITTDYGNAEEGPWQWVAEQLQKRNRAWTPPLPEANRYVRTTCSMTTLDPVILKDLSKAEVRYRTKISPHKDGNRMTRSMTRILHMHDSLPDLFD